MSHTSWIDDHNGIITAQGPYQGRIVQIKTMSLGYTLNIFTDSGPKQLHYLPNTEIEKQAINDPLQYLRDWLNAIIALSVWGTKANRSKETLLTTRD